MGWKCQLFLCSSNLQANVSSRKPDCNQQWSTMSDGVLEASTILIRPHKQLVLYGDGDYMLETQYFKRRIESIVHSWYSPRKASPTDIVIPKRSYNKCTSDPRQDQIKCVVEVHEIHSSPALQTVAKGYRILLSIWQCCDIQRVTQCSMPGPFSELWTSQDY